MARLSLKRCITEGYDAIQSANFWAAVGDAKEERSALSEAQHWFWQPMLLELNGREKALPLLHQVDERMRGLREKERF